MPTLQIVQTKRYKQGYKRYKKSGYDLIELESVIDTIASGMKLQPKYRDHELTGNFSGFRECHIRSNWLLMYAIERKELLLILVDTGTHKDVLGVE